MMPVTHDTLQKGRPTVIQSEWWELATAIPGKAVNLAIGLWLLMSRTRSPTVRITRRMMARVNISRYAAGDALRRLEAAGLVQVWRLPGRSPMVTVVAPGTGIPLDLRRIL